MRTGRGGVICGTSVSDQGCITCGAAASSSSATLVSPRFNCQPPSDKSNAIKGR